MTDKIEQLAKLNDLKEKNIISDKEFEKSKQDILTSFSSEIATVSSNKSRTVDLLLCLFLGGIGAHRFYTGYIGLGLLYIFTFGILGIGVFVDLILIICGVYKDSFGKHLKNW